MANLDNKLPTKNFLTRLSELKLETGTTGAAKFRKLFLDPSENLEAPSIDNHGGILSGMLHFHMASGQTDTIYYHGVPLPTDYVIGTASLNYIYTNAGTSGDIAWKTKVVQLSIGSDSGVTLHTEGLTGVTVSSSADQVTLRKLLFSVQPKRNTFLVVKIARHGSDGKDTNIDQTSLWSTWIEYLAYT